MNHQYDILVVKDFSRFSRRNSRGLVELEDLRDVGIRIISIGDGIDFPNDNDWLKIQFQFLLNECLSLIPAKGEVCRQAATGRRRMDLRRSLWLHHQQAETIRDCPNRSRYHPSNFAALH